MSTLFILMFAGGIFALFGLVVVVTAYTVLVFFTERQWLACFIASTVLCVFIGGIGLALTKTPL